MTEMEPGEAGIENLLRSSLAAPVPSLPPDFDQRLMRKVRRASQPFGSYHRPLFAGYGVTSVVTSAAVMRGQGLHWGPIALMVLGPLALAAALPWLRGAARPATRHSAG